jgi:hypothetical protein
MNQRKWKAFLIGSALVALILVMGLTIFPVVAQGPGGMMGRGGITGGYGYNNNSGYGPGWMMGKAQGYAGMPCGYGMMGNQGYRGMMGGGMMWNNNSPFSTTEPLSIAQAAEAVNDYLTGLNNPNLELGEVMIFDNHAYAQIIEKDGNIGAMEVLVDPQTKTVYPEMGPNMMWNLKYGMMSGYGGHGMMGYTPPVDPSAEMPVSPEAAVKAAQTYLDANVGSDLTADEHADNFYGYYTLHVNRDGKTVGMLSVNGYTGQVFLHTWHGNLLEMSGE